MTIKPGRYRHFKGNEYQVLGVARHSETGEEMVIYRPLYGEKALWVRPLEMFTEQVERDGRRMPRFAPLQQESEPASPPEPPASPAPAAAVAARAPATVTATANANATTGLAAGIRVFEVNGREYRSLAEVPEPEQVLVHRALAEASRNGESPGERLVVSLEPADIADDRPDFSHISIIETPAGWAKLTAAVVLILLLLWWLFR